MTAAAAIAAERGMRYVLSYAAQQASGIWSWERDDAGKARSLIAPVLGGAKAEALIARIGTLEQVADVRALRTRLTP